MPTSTSKSGKRYLPTAAVKARYGDVSDMWIERRLKDPNSGFPRPYYFGPGQRHRRWDEAELDEYDRQCARRFKGTSARAKQAQRYPDAAPDAVE